MENRQHKLKRFQQKIRCKCESVRRITLNETHQYHCALYTSYKLSKKRFVKSRVLTNSAQFLGAKKMGKNRDQYPYQFSNWPLFTFFEERWSSSHESLSWRKCVPLKAARNGNTNVADSERAQIKILGIPSDPHPVLTQNKVNTNANLYFLTFPSQDLEV